MKTLRLAGIAGLALSLQITGGCGQRDAQKGDVAGGGVLRFSAIPSQTATEMKEKFDAFAKYMEHELDVKVEYVHAADYAASVQAFANGQIQLAWFGGLTGAQARHKVPGARAIVFGEEDPQFHSYFIAHKSTGLVPGDEFPLGIAKFAFTFGSPSSTSGRLMPEHFIRQHTGKAPAEFFEKEPFFSGSHPKTIELVASGQYPVGVCDYKEWEKAVAAGKVDPQIVSVIWKTPAYADYGFTAHPVLETMFGAGFTDRLQKALIACKDPGLLAAFPRKSLIVARNEDFVQIEQIAQELGFLN